MSSDEREMWDRKYREGSHGLTDPDPLLPYAYEEFVQPLFPQGGAALDVAGGVGRHSIFMAKHGWKVTTFQTLASLRPDEMPENWAT